MMWRSEETFRYISTNEIQFTMRNHGVLQKNIDVTMIKRTVRWNTTIITRRKSSQ